MITFDNLQEARLNFLHDTIHFYGTDTKRRATNGEHHHLTKPAYKTRDGKKCSIGRHIDDVHRPEDMIGSIKNLSRLVHGDVTTMTRRHYENINAEDVLPEKIYQLGKNFLNEVQCLHDRSCNWNEDFGLSYDGQAAYKKIVEKFCSNHLDYDANF